MSERSTRTRGRRPWAATRPLAVVALLLTACAGIPTTGAVRDGGDLRLNRVDDGVSFIGQPPVRGAGPEDVVLGFLQSGADFANDHEVARLYLTDAARQRWRPQAGTTVYDRASSALTIDAGTDGAVSVAGSELGTIDADGSFRRSASESLMSLQFGLEQVDGEWRIGALADGLVLSSVDVLETYRQVSLYFLAPSGDRLVPDSVLVPELPGLSSKLVSRLLRGPTATLREGVGTAFPPGTGLEVGSVPVRDGTATVRLDGSVLRADDRARRRMSAQLVWTLRQLPEVLRVSIRAGGENLVVGGVAEEQDRNAWQEFAPDLMPPDPSAYAVQDDVVGRFLDGRFEPVPGAGGTGDPAVRTPALSLDAARLAAVDTDGSTVYVGRLARDAALEARLIGTDLSAPSWDPGNNLWVVDRTTGVLWYLADGAAEPQQVSVPQFSGNRRPASVAVSRDGVRVALVVGEGSRARLRVLTVRRADTADPNVPGGVELSLVSARDPLPDLRDVRDVAWADATELAVLGRRGDRPVGAVYVDTDGYEVREVEPLQDPVSLTAAPPLLPQENPLVVGTADGELFRFTSGEGWQPLGAGRDPAYPG